MRSKCPLTYPIAWHSGLVLERKRPTAKGNCARPRRAARRKPSFRLNRASALIFGAEHKDHQRQSRRHRRYCHFNVSRSSRSATTNGNMIFSVVSNKSMLSSYALHTRRTLRGAIQYISVWLSGRLLSACPGTAVGTVRAYVARTQHARRSTLVLFSAPHRRMDALLRVSISVDLHSSPTVSTVLSIHSPMTL